MKRSWCNRVPAQVLVPLQCTLIWDNEMHTPHTPLSVSIPEVPPPEYTIRTFTQTLDHFNAENSGTFAQRFLVTDKYYHRGTGAPIFAMTGAEGGDVTQFYDFAYGHAVEYARKRGALILFLEHRFFGESLPFRTGSDAPLPNRLGLLSVIARSRSWRRPVRPR